MLATVLGHHAALLSGGCSGAAPSSSLSSKSCVGGVGFRSSSSRRLSRHDAVAVAVAARVVLCKTRLRRLAVIGGLGNDGGGGGGVRWRASSSVSRQRKVPTAATGTSATGGGADTTQLDAQPPRTDATDADITDVVASMKNRSQPMGRAALSERGLRWIEAAASEAAVAFIAQVDENGGGVAGDAAAVERMAPFIARRDPPPGLEGVCAAAGAHHPTANTFFTRAVQRELIRALGANNTTSAATKDTESEGSWGQGSEGEVRADYRKTPAWVALNDIAARRKKGKAAAGGVSLAPRAVKHREQRQRCQAAAADGGGGGGGGETNAAGEATTKTAAAAAAESKGQGKRQKKDKPAKKTTPAPKAEKKKMKKNVEEEEEEEGKKKEKKTGPESKTRKKTTSAAPPPPPPPLSAAAAAVAREDDGGWRRHPKDALVARIDRFVTHAGAMLALEREAEAASAAALLLQESASSASSASSESSSLLTAAASPAAAVVVAEGTSVGRAGAVMEGLQLVGTTAGPAAGTQLLDFRIVGGGVLPPSAIGVGDRVAVAIVPGGGGSVDEGEEEGVAGMGPGAGRPRGGPGNNGGGGGGGGGGSRAPRRSYEVEGVVRVLDAAAGEVTLVVDPLHQRRLRSNVDDDGDGKGYSLAQAADVVLAGRTLRLVRVPDVVTYERQLAALKTLRNVPGSRTNPPAMMVVRALFAASRCPLPLPEGDDKDGNAAPAAQEEEEGEDSSLDFTRVVGFFADAPEGKGKRKGKGSSRVREVAADELPPLDLTPGGGGPLPARFDAAQALAVRAALTPSAPVTWVQGPPGTGKTGVVIEIIRRAVASGQRVLACAPSNAAVDNLVERLAALNEEAAAVGGAKIDFVRVGAPERMSGAALASSLDARVVRETKGFFDAGRNVRRREIIDATRQGRATQQRLQRGRGRGQGGAQNNKGGGVNSVDDKKKGDIDAYLAVLRREQRSSTKSGRKVKAAAERSILAGADVVLATSVGAGAENIQKLPPFDLAVLDEAAQATEPAAWIPLVRCKRVVLVGDPCQLAPLVRSAEAASGGIATPLMARIAHPQQTAAAAAAVSASAAASASASEGDAVFVSKALLSSGVLGCTLTTQYRSHAAISDWASREMYGGGLAAAAAVAARTLRQLPGVAHTPATATPLLLLDTRTAGGVLLSECEEMSESEMYRRRYPGGGGTGGSGDDSSSSASSSLSSLVNEGEAYAVAVHVVGLLGAGVAPGDIAVQSPYAAQVRLIRAKLAAAAVAGQAPGAELVEVASVDSFQGREAEAVVVSTVRSNERRAVGFLADQRRMNVAVTRARRHVAIVGDSVTVGADPFLRRLLVHVRANGLAVAADDSARLHRPAGEAHEEKEEEGYTKQSAGAGGNESIEVV
jgi:hypothetical protein